MEKFFGCLDSAVSSKEHASGTAQLQQTGGFKEKGR
jgi:hypothetical protein